ncbi:MAG: NAD(P)H-dependent oxidoreductase subunit E [Actinomycetia bacterium]|nr:NAD(P)H-dependent oxidoreductase subunit E [Actinomycetes bacterium]
MPRFTPDNELLAQKIIARYPRPRSATIPLCHLAQEQDGWLSEEAMEHVAELVGATPAEVLGTASFYEMFKLHPVGKYCVNVCTNISCQLVGGEELLEHAEKSLGIRSGGTTEDGLFTLEDVECVAACTEAPAVQVNYRYFHRLDSESFDRLIEDLRSGGLDGTVPGHGTLGKVRQDLEGDRIANITPPEAQGAPVWIERAAADAAPAGEGS